MGKKRVTALPDVPKDMVGQLIFLMPGEPVPDGWVRYDQNDEFVFVARKETDGANGR